MANVRRTTKSLLLLGALACVGYLMYSIPPKLIEQYQAVSQWGTLWVYLYFGFVGSGAALLLGSSGWIVWTLLRRKREKQKRRLRRDKNPSELSRDQQQLELEENVASVEQMATDWKMSSEMRQHLESLVGGLADKRDRQELEIVAFGTISSGKSSLLNALAGRDIFQTEIKGGTTVSRNEADWPGMDRVTLVDTPGLGEVDGVEHAAISATAARNADLILVVVDGPLRDSEHQLLARLGQMEKRILVCLNKDDWYEPEDRDRLLGQIRHQVSEFVQDEDVVAVRSRPTKRTRVRVLADGDEQQETVDVQPDISPLANRMMKLLGKQGNELLLANLLLQSRGIVEHAREKVQAAVDKQAWEVVDKYTWGAAGAAALSPFPVLDLISGSAISTKMVVDLAHVYRQDVDADSAVKLLGELGKNLIAILGVGLATPAVVSGVASLLKTVPGAGTIAGGMLQGIVQAIVTRWIGGVFIEYFKNEMRQPEGGLVGLARREWDRLTTANELRKLVQTARQKLVANPDDE